MALKFACFTVVMAMGLAARAEMAGCAGGCCASEAASAAQTGHDHAGMMAAKAEKAAVGDPYTLATDPVTGEKLGSKPVAADYNGRQLLFASQKNADQFKADPKTYLAKVDKQMIEQQKALYPLTTCVVSGDKLGGMGEGVDVIFNNRLVRLCCADCQKDLAKDPAKYLKQIDEAVIKAQKDKYPLKKCVVTGESLGSMGDAVDYVAGNRLVRFCCSGCIDKLKANPTFYLQKIETAAKN